MSARSSLLALALFACAEPAPPPPPPSPPEPTARPEALPEPAAEPAEPARSPALDLRLTSLSHAPFPAPEGAPLALVHAAEGALAHGVHVVLFLHGYSGCVEVLARSGDVRCIADEPRTHPGFGVLDAHDGAGTATVLVLPQLAWMTRDGDPGGFRREGEALAFLEEALAAAGVGTPIDTVTIAAHSAAFETTIAIVRQGGLGDRLRNVVLLDALYSGGPAFLGWVRAGTAAAPRTLVSLYTGGTTATRSAALGRDAAVLGEAALIEPSGGLSALASVTAPARVLVLDVPGPHGDVPRNQLGPALAALGLPMR